MKTTDNITVTNGRLKKALDKQVSPIIMPKVSKQIIKAVNDSKLQIGTVTKFYPYLDKYEVKLNGQLVICSVLHRYAGELFDFYTPFGDEDYCPNLNEPCIIPRAELNCLVLDVQDGTDEQILMGFVHLEDIIGISPARNGFMKISSTGITNEEYIEFGQGLRIHSRSAPDVSTGDMFDEAKEVNYANSNDTYTKEEIDKMIEDLRNELTGEDNDLES